MGGVKRPRGVRERADGTNLYAKVGRTHDGEYKLEHGDAFLLDPSLQVFSDYL